MIIQDRPRWRVAKHTAQVNKLKPSSFEYKAPKDLQEALGFLAYYGESCKVLAGGQSLVPMMNLRLCRYDALVDINNIEEMAYIQLEGDELCVGAMVRHYRLMASSLVAQHAPLLALSARYVAHAPIRRRGTIGGSVCHADPAAEFPTVLLALDATMVVRGQDGERRLVASEFFMGPLSTALAPDELLVEVRIPIRRPKQGHGFDEVSRRPGDFAIVGLAASVDLVDERIEAARLAVCGLQDGQIRLRKAEELLTGEVPEPERLRAIAHLAAQDVAAHSDLHAEADYRRHLIEVLLPRVVAQGIAVSREHCGE